MVQKRNLANIFPKCSKLMCFSYYPKLMGFGYQHKMVGKYFYFTNLLKGVVLVCEWSWISIRPVSFLSNRGNKWPPIFTYDGIVTFK